MIQIHGVPSIEEVVHVRTQEDISREMKAFIDTYKQVSLAEYLTITKDNITGYVVELVRMYTKLVTLSNQVNSKRTTLITNALEHLHKHDEEKLQITHIVVEYKLWCTYLTK